jgi:cytochrome c oxidase assembly protein subunit 15
MSLDKYKTIYYWEYLHRMIGRFIGLLFFFPFIYFYYKNYLNKGLIKKLLLLLFLGMIQGFIGWYMVKSGLVDNPHVSHYRLSVHLFLAFIIIGYIYKTKLSLRYRERNKVLNFRYFNRFINIIIVMFFVQIIYGAFTAGLKAADFWNTFPLINGKIVPDNLFVMNPIYLNFIEHNKLIQFIHRYIGLFLLFLIYIYSFQIKDLNMILNLKSRNLIVIVTCQVFLGILTLVSKAPIILASSHQILAIFLLLQLINVKYFLKYK